MIFLWIAAALVSAGAAALIVHRAARGAGAGGGENPSLAVYRRQMAELDELAARGLLAENERRGVRAETGRRLLAAAERREAPLRAASPGVILAVAAAAPIAAFAAYVAVVGMPGAPDQPYARRLAEWADSPVDSLSAPQLAALMRAAAAKAPTDPGPLYFLARYEFAAGQSLEAGQALDRALALAPQRADLWDLKGEVEAALADGEITPAARADFQHALALDPRASGARFHFALEKIKGGDVAGGLADWRALLASLDPADPRRQGLTMAIAQVQAAGGLPQGGPAPQVGGPQIQAMVDGLAARLKAQPDDPAGWVRLVRAYTVLGQTVRRDAALAEARRRYAAQPDVLRQLDQAARPAS